VIAQATGVLDVVACTPPVPAPANPPGTLALSPLLSRGAQGRPLLPTPTAFISERGRPENLHAPRQPRLGTRVTL